MSFLRLLPAGLLLTLQVPALPNPHPMITAPPDALLAKRFPNPQAASSDSYDFGGFDSGGSTYYSDWSNYSIPASILSQESAEYYSYTKEFYSTVSPSELSAIEAYNAEESALYASWATASYETLSPSQSAELEAEYNSWASAAEQSLSPSQSAALEAEYNSWTAQLAASSVPPTPARKPVNTVPDPAIANANVAAATLGPLPETDSPSVHGITCVNQSNDVISAVKGAKSINVTACAVAAQNACRKLNQSKTGAYFWDQWVWSGGRNPGESNNDDTLGCGMAYWLPKSLVHDPGVPFTTVPDQQTCEQNVYSMMVKTCAAKSNAASINVAVLPNGQKGNTGQQVDSGQVSYLLAPNVYPCGGYGCSD